MYKLLTKVNTQVYKFNFIMLCCQVLSTAILHILQQLHLTNDRTAQVSNHKHLLYYFPPVPMIYL